MKRFTFWINLVFLVFAVATAHAQGRGGRGAASPPPTPKAGAPIDLTGYWVSLVTQDWRVRMFPSPKGDYAGIPLNAAARKVADAWDPAKDEAAGEQCRSYGAPNLMRIPGRLHFTWQDDQILKLEADAGTQTRLLRFESSEARGGDWQGVSRASWEYLPASVVDTQGLARGSVDRRGGSLKVVTTSLKSGYLRKNGVPYSANTVLTEYFDRVTEPNGDSYLLVTSTVEDPTYLAQPLTFSTQFKKQADASGWNPIPCSAK
jgi:hypothetical protein